MLLSTGPFNFLAIRIDMADADCQSSNGRTRPNPGRLSGTERPFVEALVRRTLVVLAAVRRPGLLDSGLAFPRSTWLGRRGQSSGSPRTAHRRRTRPESCLLHC